MRLHVKMLTGAIGAGLLLTPLVTGTPAAANDDKDPVQITSAKLVRDGIVVRGTYVCDQPFKARFIEAEATQYQGEDGEDEVRGMKALWDRPCTGVERQFQVTLKADKGSKFISSEQGGTVYVQVEVTITDQANMWEDTQFAGADLKV